MSLIDDINNLDPENPGMWPLPIKMIAIGIACAAILYAGWHYDINPQRETITKEEETERELKESFQQKQKRSANLKALREQMQEMKQTFGDMIRQLPNKTEVAGLIIDISQTGLAAGLEFDLFKPNKEQSREFYSELPINIIIRGNYHQIGEFVSGVAALPRIVTTHDISLSKGKGNNQLTMTAVAKTYSAHEE